MMTVTFLYMLMFFLGGILGPDNLNQIITRFFPRPGRHRPDHSPQAVSAWSLIAEKRLLQDPRKVYIHA
jgi:hypothetical protein